MTPADWELVYGGAVAAWESARRVDAWKLYALTVHRVEKKNQSRYTPDVILAGAPPMVPSWWMDGKR